MRIKRFIASTVVWILIVAVWIIYGSWVTGLSGVPIWTIGGILSLLGAIGAFIGLIILTVITFLISFD